VDTSTRRVFMTDLGCNGYPNRFVKSCVDCQLPHSGSPVLVDPIEGRDSRHGNMVWVRYQIDF